MWFAERLRRNAGRLGDSGNGDGLNDAHNVSVHHADDGATARPGAHGDVSDKLRTPEHVSARIRDDTLTDAACVDDAYANSRIPDSQHLFTAHRCRAQPDRSP